MDDQLKQIPVEYLERGKYQPRKEFDPVSLQELAESIRAQGIIEPIIVRPIAAHHYEIIAGERRWRAAQLAGLSMVACVVREYTDAQAAEVTLIENIQREDLNPIEEARALQRLIDEFLYTHEELATAVGKSRTKISNCLRLLQLDHRVQKLLVEKVLTEGHGKALASVTCPNIQFQIARKCQQQVWSVRQIEQEVRKYRTEVTHKVGSSAEDPNLQRLERIIAEYLGTEVHLENQAGKSSGWVKVKYYDFEILAGILEKMGIELEEVL